MQKYLLYKKETGEVKMYCEGKPEYDPEKLECVKLNISDTDMKKVKEHKHYLYIENKKLKFKLK